MAGLRKTGLVALFYKFDVVFESFLFSKIRAISWKICVKTCGDILMTKIVYHYTTDSRSRLVSSRNNALYTVQCAVSLLRRINSLCG